jgi:hypothetical protein
VDIRRVGHAVPAYRFFVPSDQADPHMTLCMVHAGIVAQPIRARPRFTRWWSNAGMHACWRAGVSSGFRRDFAT